MRLTKRAATAIGLGGALLLGHSAAFAKGPVTVDVPGSAILVKEHDERALNNFPWNLEEGRTEDLTFTMSQEVEDPDGGDTVEIGYTMEIPWIEVEKEGDDIVTLTMDRQIFSVSFPDGPGGDRVELSGEVTYEDLNATFNREGERMKFDADASAFTMEMLPSEALRAQGGDLKYSIDGKGMSMSGEGAVDQDYTDMRSLDLSYDYSLDSMNADVSVTSPEGENFDMTMQVGKTVADASIGQGKMSTQQTMSGFAIDVTAPMPMKFAADSMEIGVAMPLEPSPKPQDIAYKVGIEGLEIDETVWAMADPLGAFPKEINRVMIDLSMQAMLMVSFLDPEAMAQAEQSGMPPLIPTGVKINEIAFDGMGLKVDATGEGELKGTQPEGSAYITVKGLSDFVASAKKAGMFGDQEAMMIEGMAGQLGKEGDDGELIFDVETDGQMINVNGNPVMPMPGME